MNIDITVIINQMVILLLLMLLGVILCRVGIMNADFNKRLTKILLNVTTPALILSSVLTQTGERDISSVALVFAIAIATYILLPLISFVCVKLVRLPLKEQGLYMFMTVYSNVGFMGFPVLSALLGAKAVFYAAIFNIIFNLSIYTLGIVLIHYGQEAKAPLNFKSLFSPGVLLSVFSVIVYFFNVRLPYAVQTAIDSAGSLTVPLAMMILGATLATMNVRELFDDWKLYPYTLLRQLALPIASFFLLKLFVSDTFILNISTILLMMPVANTSVLYATEYGADKKTAAKAVFFTTIVSVVTIPFLIYILL